MNEKGLLGYAGDWNDNVICALQVETADCIKNIDEIAAVPGLDMLFLGQNDLCMSMGLYEKYKFPDMYTSPELMDATNKLVTPRPRRTTSFSACSCSAPAALANSSRRASPSSASETISTIS